MYLFLLGRDSDLSKLEFAIYFHSRKIKYNVLFQTKDYLIVNFREDSKTISSDNPYNINFQKVMDELAGITRIVKIYFTSNHINTDFLDTLDLYYPRKFNYSISTFGLSKKQKIDLEELSKDYFKLLKSKAVYKRAIKHNDKYNFVVNPQNYYSWKLYNGFEVFVLNRDNQYYFGKTIACFNPKINKFKDKHKPVSKNLYTTSLRLTDIMINLLGLKKGSTVVDPFSGAGTFVMELLSKGYNVVGIEKSKDMYEVSIKNIEWMKKEFDLKNTYKILNNSSEFASFKAEAAVFEPYMGPFLNNLPSYNHAKHIVRELNQLYFNVFKNLNLRLKDKSRVVCIVPRFKTKDGKTLKINMNLFKKTGFRVVNLDKYNNNDFNIKNPILYNTPDGSKLLREIYILENIK